jgi:hypothetical protein
MPPTILHPLIVLPKPWRYTELRGTTPNTYPTQPLLPARPRTTATLYIAPWLSPHNTTDAYRAVGMV